MAACAGTRIDHLDGTLAACSRELLGLVCRGHEHVASVTCEDLLGVGGCETCEIVFHAEALVRAAASAAEAVPDGHRHRTRGC